jgi:hypothetical protein
MDTNLLPIRILHDFVDRMEKLEIGYMLTGSMAMMNYSVYRMTADVDVIVEFTSADKERIIEMLEPDYYIPHKSMSRAISTKHMFNVIHIETAFKIDCVVKKTSEFQLNAFNRRQQADFFGKDIWIITQDDLIISKLWWAKDSNSEKQLTDVKNLMRNDFDAEYISRWTKELRAFHLFEKCLGDLIND